MKFATPLVKATLLRRYKRFLADVILADGSQITVHCPNTGSMKQCIHPHSPCWLFDSNNPKRKYRYSLELLTTPTGAIAGINSARANRIVSEALENDRIAELQGYRTMKTEKPYGNEKSRIDIWLGDHPTADDCYIEIKSVTLEENIGEGFFPDAVSVRGQKHLRELTALTKNKKRAVLFYCVQHSAITSVAVAEHIDTQYAALYEQAKQAGVEIIAYNTALSSEELTLDRPLSVIN